MSEEIKIDNIKFGENLKRIRKQRGWSQQVLANKLDTSKQVISHYEKAQRFPKISFAAKCAVVLGVSLYELTGIKPKYSAKEVQEIIASDPPATPQLRGAKILSSCADVMKPDELDRAIGMMKIMFPQYNDILERKEDDNDR